jgi:hypothetical protein
VAGGEQDGRRARHAPASVEGGTATGAAGKRASRAGVRCRPRPPEIRAGPVDVHDRESDGSCGRRRVSGAGSGILLGRRYVVRLSALPLRAPSGAVRLRDLKKKYGVGGVAGR